VLKNVTGFCRFSVNCRDDSLAAADSVRDGVFLLTRSMVYVIYCCV